MYGSKECSRPLMAGEAQPQGIAGLEGAMNKAATKSLPGASCTSQFRESAAWLAVLLTGATILLLAALHVLSPEFSPSWRVISEYAFGHYAWVLSLMFCAWAQVPGRWRPPFGPRSTRVAERWACGCCSSPVLAGRWLRFLISRTRSDMR
jgi:hypothetical protein